MIVGKCFPEDEDHEVQWMQHDVYWESVALILETARVAYLRAQRTIGVSSPEIFLLKTLRGFDHRTLQNAHDLIAVYWRFRSNLKYPRLPVVAPTIEMLKEDWRQWLRAELRSLCEFYPEFVQAVVRAAAYGNLDLGYEAEKSLDEMLRRHYADMFQFELQKS